MRIKHILAAIDFSPDSLHALRHACDLAQELAADLLVLHVVDQTYLAATPELHAANPALAKLLDAQWKRAGADMARIGAGVKKELRRCRTLVKRGSPPQTIVTTAQRSGTDLIVMGTHGRTGLAHLLIGSVAERVVRRARCPVLTIRRTVRMRRPAKRRPRRRAG